jgi:hypothetical protein
MTLKYNNIILTGVPRSGTTLTCHLLNKLPDTVALHEPMMLSWFANSGNHEDNCDRIDLFYKWTRKSLCENGKAISKQVGSRIPDNPIGGHPNLFPFFPKRCLRFLNNFVKDSGYGLRKSQVSRGMITIEKTLSSNFLLCIKHNAGFAVILESLLNRYPCYAVVRNPLSVLASWNSVDFPAQKGRIPAAERVDSVLAKRLIQISDKFDRQLHILSWFFEKFYTLLPLDNVLYYEDIITSGGAVLKVITGKAIELDEKLRKKNKNSLYDHKLMLKLGDKLLKMDGAFWEFYSRESVEQLLQEIDR